MPRNILMLLAAFCAASCGGDTPEGIPAEGPMCVDVDMEHDPDDFGHRTVYGCEASCRAGFEGCSEQWISWRNGACDDGTLTSLDGSKPLICYDSASGPCYSARSGCMAACRDNAVRCAVLENDPGPTGG